MSRAQRAAPVKRSPSRLRRPQRAGGWTEQILRNVCFSMSQPSSVELFEIDEMVPHFWTVRRKKVLSEQIFLAVCQRGSREGVCLPTQVAMYLQSMTFAGLRGEERAKAFDQLGLELHNGAEDAAPDCVGIAVGFPHPAATAAVAVVVLVAVALADPHPGRLRTRADPAEPHTSQPHGEELEHVRDDGRPCSNV